MAMNPAELRVENKNWIVQLKTILGQGSAPPLSDRTKSEHRSTKKAVKLLLSNLREGVKVTDTDTKELDVNKVVFNAVEQLIEDKVDETKKHKNKLEALTKFQTALDQQFKAQSKKKGALDNAWKGRIDEAVRALQKEEWLNLPEAVKKDIVLNTKAKSEASELRQEMLKSQEGREVLGKILSSMDPASLKEIYPKSGEEKALDFDRAFGSAKNGVLAEALVASLPDKEKKPPAVLNPELFGVLATNVPPDAWNDETARPGALKGLGPRVCAALWQNGAYDQLCELIKHGVDTSLAANVGVKVKGPGIYSGFIQPIQHVIQGQLRDIDKLGTDEAKQWPEDRKSKAEGAKKIFRTLEKQKKAVTLTKWSDVEKSDMIEKFEKNPGTIWGFENIRMPYVQAAHGTKQGAQPLRMMELWEAVTNILSVPSAYNKLIDDPKNAVDEFIDAGVKEIEGKIEEHRQLVKDNKDDPDYKFADIADMKEFIDNFKRDAKAFLLEFAAQMPKGTLVRPSLDEKGKQRVHQEMIDGRPKYSNVYLLDEAGIVPGKFMGGLACKAGLWWAKKEKKPVYYCLDGINMDDVTNYKKVRNKAIEDFINGGGKQGGGKGHEEVITLVELREILKHWDGPDGLEDTVKFVLKGKTLTGDELKNKVKAWQEAMEKANKGAGRTPAPDFNTFANELNKIDPGLIAKLGKETDAKKANMDARDIVKKYGYLVKVAKTRPHIVLKYIMSKCQVLIEYGLISEGLPDACRQLNEAEENWMTVARGRVRNQLYKCHKDFRAPLEAALLR